MPEKGDDAAGAVPGHGPVFDALRPGPADDAPRPGPAVYPRDPPASHRIPAHAVQKVAGWRAAGTFYLVSGSLEFLNGDQTFVANAGDFVFVPRGPRHRFRNLSDDQAHMVSFFTPGGGEALWLEGGDDPVPGAKPEFWPPERGLALGPLLVRKDIDMEILPEEADLDGAADEA